MKKVYLHQKIRMGIAACCLVVFFVLSVANAPMYAGPLTAWLNKETLANRPFSSFSWVLAQIRSEI